ncbi:hypothetical protein ABTH88_21135, partial [Acinetobacter baumannii]
NSVLYLPAGSAMLTQALAISTSFSKTAPWWPLEKKVRRYLSATAEQVAAAVAGKPAPVFKKTFRGPHVLTHLAKTLGLRGRA